MNCILCVKAKLCRSFMSIGPGKTVLTVIWWALRSLVSVWDTWLLAPFEEAWMSTWGTMVYFLVVYDEIKIMWPPVIKLLHKKSWGTSD